MKPHSCLIAVGLVLSLAACVAEYTEAEAPKQLTLDNASAHVGLRFAGGSSRLLAGDAARLRALVATGGLTPSDRVIVATGGSPPLADARFTTIAHELLNHNIVASRRSLAGVGFNQAIVMSERYVVNLPPCPNWSKNPAIDFTNTHASNFGCATAVNFGQMVANPADLAEGRPLGPADAIPAAAAVQRYQSDKVQLPTAAAVGPIVVPTTAPTGSGATGAGTAGNQP